MLKPSPKYYKIFKRRTRLTLGLSQQGLALIRTEGWITRQNTVINGLQFNNDGAPSLQAIGEQLRTHLALTERRKSNLHIVVADEFARYFIVTPPKNMQRFVDCQAAANMRFQALYGESSSAWQIEADWDARRPFLACALPLELIRLQTQAAQGNRIRLTRLTPHFIAAWNRWRKKLAPNAWFGVAGENTLLLAAINGERLCAVRTIAFAASWWQDKDVLSQQIAREALRLCLPMPQKLQVCGQLPPNFHRLDCDGLGVSRLQSDDGIIANLPPPGERSLELNLALQGVQR